MKPIRVLIADESPAMRRWYAAALSRVAQDVQECETGWQLLLNLSEEPSYDLVIASKSLSGLGGAQILAMLRTADVRVPFVLVAPFCDGSTRALVGKVSSAALVEDPLDAVKLVEAAETLLRMPAAAPASTDKIRRAALRAHARRWAQDRAAS